MTLLSAISSALPFTVSRSLASWDCYVAWRWFLDYACSPSHARGFIYYYFSREQNTAARRLHFTPRPLPPISLEFEHACYSSEGTSEYNS